MKLNNALAELFFKQLFLSVLGLRCWAGFSCCERGLLSVAVCGLLTGLASLVVEQGL